MVSADAPRSGGIFTRRLGQRGVDEHVELVLVARQPHQLLGGHPVGERHLVVVDHLVEPTEPGDHDGALAHRAGIHDGAGPPWAMTTSAAAISATSSS